MWSPLQLNCSCLSLTSPKEWPDRLSELYERSFWETGSSSGQHQIIQPEMAGEIPTPWGPLWTGIPFLLPGWVIAPCTTQHRKLARSYPSDTLLSLSYYWGWRDDSAVIFKKALKPASLEPERKLAQRLRARDLGWFPGLQSLTPVPKNLILSPDL